MRRQQLQFDVLINHFHVNHTRCGTNEADSSVLRSLQRLQPVKIPPIIALSRRPLAYPSLEPTALNALDLAAPLHGQTRSNSSERPYVVIDAGHFGQQTVKSI
jgi:hypothetical protein